MQQEIKDGGAENRAAVRELGVDRYDRAVREENVVLVEFYSDDCGHCRTMIPVLEEYAKTHPGTSVYRVNISREPQLASREGIRRLPTFRVYRNGVGAGEFFGSMRQSELERAVASALDAPEGNG